MSTVFFKTGEFAALCGVKKDTLLHYDQIGILRPMKTEENNYRYYTVKQLNTFDLISALKKLGMPLSEIKSYLDRRNPEDFLILLRQQEKILAEEQRRLDLLRLLLEESIGMTELALTVPPGTIRLEDCRSSYYVAVHAPDYEHYDEQEFLLASRALVTWARENSSLSLRAGDIVTQESLARDCFVEDYYYSAVPNNAADHATGVEVLQKPAGSYAVLYHQGSYETLEGAYEKLTRWVRAEGHTIEGDLFEEDLLHYMSSANPDDYVMRISIKVKPNAVCSKK